MFVSLKRSTVKNQIIIQYIIYQVKITDRVIDYKLNSDV